MNPLKRILLASSKRGDYLDLHLHTGFSVDVINGNTFIDYMECAQQHGIVPGFLDHFQAEKLEWDNYPFGEKSVGLFFEAYDNAKATGLPSFLGLEVDFYDPNQHEDWNLKTMDWLDDHKEDFDYFVGTIHDVDDFTITIPFELEELLKDTPFRTATTRYFTTLLAGISSSIQFSGFAHLDVIYRFCGNGGILPREEAYMRDERTSKAIESCISRDIVVEINLRGFDHPWNTTYPSWELLAEFLEDQPEADSFFIGSDSHDINTFKRFIPRVKEYSDIIRGKR